MNRVKNILLVSIIIISGSISSGVFAENENDPWGGLKKGINVIKKGKTALNSFEPVKYKEEKSIGGAVALKIFSQYGGPYQDEKVARYISLVGKSVALVSDRPGIPYYFAVLDSREEANAFAAPGGYIFVTVGLLKKLNSEAELACVLGHEIAHVAKKHYLDALEIGKLFKGIKAGVSIFDNDPKLFSDTIDKVSDVLFKAGVDPSLEYEADKLGAIYASRLGYQPRALNEFLGKLSMHRSEGGKSVFYQTHPSLQSRITKLKSELLNTFSSFENYKTVANRYEAMKK